MSVQTLTQYLPAFLGGAIAWVLLGLRLIWGAILISYSLPMIKNPLHWMDRGEQSSGFPPLLQAAGAFTIFGGGIAVIVGFLTPLAALGLAGAMAIALALHLLQGTPFVKAAPDAPGESYDNSLLYLAIALLFVFLGSGIFSLDYLLFG
ncbi:MAG: DoxX family membrane protein [Cyanobacteria bacterium J06638_22]